MQWLTPLYVLALLASSAVRLWLAERQAAAVARHRDAVPVPFKDSVSAVDHAKAADYTLAKVRLARISTIVDAALVLWLTLGGAIATVDSLS